jgi:quercetin dioxygenase-like cupin family protein
MPLQVRRVVTGHDGGGRAVVAIDNQVSGVERAGVGVASAMLWTTEGWPVDNTVEGDLGQWEGGLTLKNGSVFRIVEFGPGNGPRMHRTDSVDYAIVMSGEIDMELDDGASVHLQAGDVLVQRGTIHNWQNRGSEPCRIAFILIDARPVEVGGKLLSAHG